VLGKKNDAQAIPMFERALELRPSNPACKQSLGIALVKSEPERAETLLREVVAAVPNAVAAHAQLAVIAEARGDLKGAVAQVREVIRYAPLDHLAMRSLASLLRKLGDHEGEVQTGLTLLRLVPNDTRLRGVVSLGFRLWFDSVWTAPEKPRREDAILVLRQWLAHDPRDPIAVHMLASLTGADVPERATSGYVATHFDGFAATFDSTLTALDYRAPSLAHEALKRAIPTPSGTLDLLDMGAGTGRLGPLVAGWKKRLVGVDLSPKMLEKAAALGIYDQIVESDIVEFARSHPGEYDAAFCVDTLVYFGVLGPLFEATFGALRAGGHFFGTVEQLHADGNAGFELIAAGRYRHTEKFLTDALRLAGFSVADVREERLRMEDGKPVMGFLFSAVRPG
jgi:predicted TPR repeat methyltransferase